MAPNLYVALKTVVQPQTWFHKDQSFNSTSQKSGQKKPQSSLHLVQHCDHPEPGLYKHIPGCGWFQIAKSRPKRDEVQILDSGAFSISDEQEEKLRKPSVGYTPVNPPRAVVYSKVLKRFLFEDNFRARKLTGRVVVTEHDKNGRQPPAWAAKRAKKRPSGFFRLDDGVSWVHCWDAYGEFLPGPWEKYCLEETHSDESTGKVEGEAVFRLMRVGDQRYGVDNEKWRTRRAEMLAEKEKEDRKSKDSKKTRSNGSSVRSSGADDESTSRGGSIASPAGSGSDSSVEHSPEMSRMPSVSEEVVKQELTTSAVQEGPQSPNACRRRAQSDVRDFAVELSDRLRIDER